MTARSDAEVEPSAPGRVAIRLLEKGITMDIEYTSESAIREWLLKYMKPGAESRAEVDCIMSQDGWMHIDALADKFAGSQFQQGPEAFSEGVEFALSALVECHDGPHTSDCPSFAYELNVDRARALVAADMRAGQFYMVQVYDERSCPIGAPVRVCPSQFADWDLWAGWTLEVFQ